MSEGKQIVTWIMVESIKVTSIFNTNICKSVILRRLSQLNYHLVFGQVPDRNTVTNAVSVQSIRVIE